MHHLWQYKDYQLLYLLRKSSVVYCYKFFILFKLANTLFYHGFFLFVGFSPRHPRHTPQTPTTLQLIVCLQWVRKNCWMFGLCTRKTKNYIINFFRVTHPQPICHSCNHQNLRFASTSFLSSMDSSLQLESLIYTDVMNTDGKFQQLRNSRNK